MKINAYIYNTCAFSEFFKITNLKNILMPDCFFTSAVNFFIGTVTMEHRVQSFGTAFTMET